MTFTRDEPTPLPVSVESPADLIGVWVVAQVRGQYERRVASMLAEIGVGYYLPFEEVMRRDDGGKRRITQKLLFPNYVFVCCRHDDDRYELVARENILKVLEEKNQPRLASELDAIHKATVNGLLRDPYGGMVAGRACRVASGPLRGKEGVVIRRGREDVVVLQVSILGAARELHVPVENVELI